MKRIVFLILLLCALFASSCSGRPPELSSTESYRLRMLYADSACVVKAVCSGAQSSSGYFLFDPYDVIAGAAPEKIEISADRLSSGSEYILFFDSTDEGTSYDDKNVTLIQLYKESVVWDGVRYSRAAVERILSECKSTLTFPFITYFYETRSDLINGCSNIIIGRPAGDVSIEERNTYTKADTVSRSKMMKCNITSVRVTASLRGDIPNGSEIQMIFSPESVSSMTDASTLNTVSLAVKDIAGLNRGGYYIFFLNKTDDSKQDVYFPVNPVQGWIELKRDSIAGAEKNSLFDDCKQLKQLISELNLSSSQDPVHNVKPNPIGE